MATITAAQVKELRERTGAGMLECKKALEATGGNIDKAVDRLREQGLAAAAKKSGRIAAEGRVHAYVHGEGRIGVLVEINSETDFVGKSDAFKEFCQDIGMQIAAMRPQYVRKDEVPAEVVEHERAVLKAQVVQEGKPEHIAEKIVEGRLGKFYTEICLLEQPFVKESDKTVDTYLKETIAKIGENISIRRFTRYELGEGLERRSDDFAAEVAAQVQKG